MTQKKFERILIIVIAIIVVARFVTVYNEQRHLRAMVNGDKPVPDFTWRDFDSNIHTLKELSGKVVVLHFWASWCGPCRTEFPALLMAAQILEKDAVFLAISGDEDDMPARKFVAAAKSATGVRPDNVLYGFDPMKTVIFDVFQTTAFPETIIIDSQGIMRKKLAGAQQWSSPEIINYIRDLKLAAPELPQEKLSQ
jgi:cytochrome c biogenesis protein CcmG, thiol:disulfide interchange protein DsbE